MSPTESAGRRRGCPSVLALFVSLAVLAYAPGASAQASSWLYVGGGAGVLDRGETETHSALQLDTGLGTSAKYPVVVGGMFRVQGYFGAGADLGVAARVVTRGFALGDF